MAIATNDILTSIGVPGDPNYYSVYGEAVVSSGLEAQHSAINGAGLLTRGLLWQAPDIWCYAQDAAHLSTGWTAAAGYVGSATVYVTGWTASFGYAGSTHTIATGWTASQLGNAVTWGEAP